MKLTLALVVVLALAACAQPTPLPTVVEFEGETHRSITCGDNHERCTITIENKPIEPPKPQIVRCVRRREGLAFTWPTPPTIVDCELNGVKFEIEIRSE